jgi:hypothetical protein
MRRAEILEMEPGRELDALIAEKVMGWTDFSPIDPKYDHSVGVNGYRRNFARRPNKEREEPIPLYSSDISAAWEVVEKMNDWDISIIKAGDYCEVAFGSQQPIIRKTVQEAICKAALISVLLREAPSID